MCFTDARDVVIGTWGKHAKHPRPLVTLVPSLHWEKLPKGLETLLLLLMFFFSTQLV